MRNCILSSKRELVCNLLEDTLANRLAMLVIPVALYC
jgi:hypothetical protein